MRLFLAECEGRVIAGLWCLCFGDRVGRVKAAVEQGYRSFDFEAVDRPLAETLLRGAPLSEEKKRSRHFMNLAFGSRPIRLPETSADIPSPLFRPFYRELLSMRQSVGAIQKRAR